MAREVDPVEMLGREPDERLLGDDLAHLPEAVGRPDPLVPSAARGRIVAVGAALTGITLLGGLALMGLGIAEAVTGGVAGLSLVALVVGLALVLTHWGWVHVAEATAQSLDARHNRTALERGRRWAQGIEPYPRWEVTTTVEDDGAITILEVCHRPVPAGARTYTFTREVISREIHSGEEPAAQVSERAELLRRQAAAATAAERDRYGTARDAYERTLMERDDEQQRRAALRAASEALSEQINAHLRDPPLTE
jgi:hypothetical protein